VDYTQQPSLLKAVTSIFAQAIATAFPSYDNSDSKVSKCSNLKFGDYQCSAAMPIFGSLKKQGNTRIKSPQQVASKIIAVMEGIHNPVIDSLEVNNLPLSHL